MQFSPACVYLRINTGYRINAVNAAVEGCYGLLCNVPHRLLCLNTRALVGGLMLFGVVVEPLGCKAKLADIGHQRRVLRIIA